MKYDIVIAHRVCPALSKTAVGFDDKRLMVTATTATLAAALKGLKVRLVVILDGCSDYEGIFTSTFGDSDSVDLEIVKTDATGNQATWGIQLETLSRVVDSDYVYFSEDDYVYCPEAFRAMLDFIRQQDVDFVTPLDHPDRYNGRLEKKRPSQVRISGYRHWREVSSTCLTFLAKAKVVAQSKSIMDSFRYSTEEATMWLALTKYEVFAFGSMLKNAIRHFVLRRTCGFGELMGLCAWKRQGIKLITKPRRRLFAPMPSLAVHLSNQSLPLGATAMLRGIVPQETEESIRQAEIGWLMQN